MGRIGLMGAIIAAAAILMFVALYFMIFTGWFTAGLGLLFGLLGFLVWLGTRLERDRRPARMREAEEREVRERNGVPKKDSVAENSSKTPGLFKVKP